MANIILCDIDGTVANNDHRQHFLEGKKDWDGFFSELVNDLPIQIIIDKVIQEQANGKEIVLKPEIGRPGLKGSVSFIGLYTSSILFP